MLFSRARAALKVCFLSMRLTLSTVVPNYKLKQPLIVDNNYLLFTFHIDFRCIPWVSYKVSGDTLARFESQFFILIGLNDGVESVEKGVAEGHKACMV